MLIMGYLRFVSFEAVAKMSSVAASCCLRGWMTGGAVHDVLL